MVYDIGQHEDRALRFVALEDVASQQPAMERAPSSTSANTNVVEESWSPFADTTWVIPPPSKLLTELGAEEVPSLFALPYDWQETIAQRNNLAAAPVLSAATNVEQALADTLPPETV